MALTDRENNPVINDLKKSSNDTGSIEVQIAALTAEIALLTNHLQAHKKDFSTKRGLINKVSRRKRFLRYLQNNDESQYKKVIAVLGLKK